MTALVTISLPHWQEQSQQLHKRLCKELCLFIVMFKHGTFMNEIEKTATMILQKGIKTMLQKTLLCQLDPSSELEPC